MEEKVVMGKINISLDLQNRIYIHNTHSPEILLRTQDFPLLDE